MSEILRFETNVPVEVALRYEEGKRVEGRYGDQAMYSLADGRVMYVPLFVERRIKDLGIGRNELFEICKREVRKDSFRSIEWQVRRVDSPQQPASSENGSAAAAPALSEAQNHGNGSMTVCSNGNTLDFVGRLSMMERALSGAVEIARSVESCSALRDHSVQFTSEDIRAIGLTLYIQAAREGGVRWQQ